MSRRTRRLLTILVSVMILVTAGCAVSIRKGHKAVTPEQRKLRVACIGDSITYGAGVQMTRDRDAYPVMLSDLLGEDYSVLNYGISGKTLLNETKTPYREMAFFEESQRIQPDIVLIMLGTNDSKEFNWNAGEYERQLGEFVDIYKNLPGSPEVYLMTCCAAYGAEDNDVVAFHVNKSVIANELNPMIRRVAVKCEIPVIDIYNVTKDHPEYFVDGVHPNAEGNEVIAQAVYEALVSSGSVSGSKES